VTVFIEDLRCQVPKGVLAIGSEPARLTWRLGRHHGDAEQIEYEIHTAATPSFDDLLATSGPMDGSDQVGVEAPGGPFESREVRFFRVRVRSADGWSTWSETIRVEAGLLRSTDWIARAVTLPGDPGNERPSPSPLLRHEFRIPAPIERARLHITALGLHRVSINGAKVSPDLLSPGWTSYRQRLISDSYDVTALLSEGNNAIGAELGDGWYRGRIGWPPVGRRCIYGSVVALVAQLEIDCTDTTRIVVATGPGWRASTGEVRSADLYDGSEIDLNKGQRDWDKPGFDDRKWVDAVEVPFDTQMIEPRMAPPVRVIATLDPTVSPQGDGRWLVDVGQNIAGWLRFAVRGHSHDRIVVRHAEVLEADGSLHTRALRSARATDAYVLTDEHEVLLEPVFTVHGFRYAEVSGPIELLRVEAVAISSDTAPRATFECSDAAINKLHENVVWSQRDNFVSIPTDCPQRDERLGWTGDAQAFAATAATLFDTEAFWRSWMRDLALDQDPELGVSTVVPDVVITNEPRFGRAGWADAATVVPMAVYESTGDKAIVAAQLPSMIAWVDSLVRRRGSDGLLPEAMQFGDWLDPDAPTGQPWAAKADSTYIANAFLAYSSRLTSDAARVLGDAALERSMRTLAEDMAARTWERWAHHAITNQTGCAVALRLGVAPEQERGGVAAALAKLVREAGGAVRTGFLGTPLVLPALIEFGYVDECYAMLLRREHPSWLYQVDHGATTVWERWDAIRPDGTIHPGTMAPPPHMSGEPEGHMLSFNHYAYGAVIDWVYRHVAGLAPDPASPGYRHVSVAPKPCVGLSWARAKVQAAYGPVEVSWNLEGSELTVEIDLPLGTTATFVAPATDASTVRLGDSPCELSVTLGPGHHALAVSGPAIANPSNALRRSLS
jgi:alpha-L-rhamnosidase